jgi:hypothetical protein
MVAAIRTDMVQEMRSFDPYRWRGTAHSVLLRNPYADIGLTCLDGQAAVWIERIDRDYHPLRMERCLGPSPSLALNRADAACAEPRLCPHQRPSISLGSKPPDRVSQEIPCPDSHPGEWREGSLASHHADWVFEKIGDRPLTPATPASARSGRLEHAAMTRL